MDINAISQPSATVVSVSGEIDIHTAGEFEAALLQVVQDSRDLVLDLSETTFLDSTALGVLVGADKRLRVGGNALKLVCPNQQLLKIFRISRLDSIWPVFPTVDDAMK